MTNEQASALVTMYHYVKTAPSTVVVQYTFSNPYEELASDMHNRVPCHTSCRLCAFYVPNTMFSCSRDKAAGTFFWEFPDITSNEQLIRTVEIQHPEVLL